MYQKLSIEAKQEIYKLQLEVMFADPAVREYLFKNTSDETLDNVIIDDSLSNIISLFFNCNDESNKSKLHAILDFSIRKIIWMQQEQIDFPDKSGKSTGASGPCVKGRSTLPMTTPDKGKQNPIPKVAPRSR